MLDHDHSLVTIDWQPSRASLRSFGAALSIVLIWSVVTRGRELGSAALLRDPVVLGCSALALLDASLVALRPEWLRVPYVALGAISYPLRWLLAFSSLALLYYALVTPIALCVRLTRRRRPQSVRADASSWTVTHQRPDKADYFRQF